MKIDKNLITKILKLIESGRLSEVMNKFNFEEWNLESKDVYEHIDYLNKNDFIKVEEVGRNGSIRKYFEGHDGFDLKEKGWNFLENNQ